MPSNEWKQLSDTLDTAHALDLLDLAEVRVRRVAAVVIPSERDSPEIRECLDRVGLSGLPVVLDAGGGD